MPVVLGEQMHHHLEANHLALQDMADDGPQADPESQRPAKKSKVGPSNRAKPSELASVRAVRHTVVVADGDNSFIIEKGHHHTGADELVRQAQSQEHSLDSLHPVKKLRVASDSHAMTSPADTPLQTPHQGDSAKRVSRFGFLCRPIGYKMPLSLKHKGLFKLTLHISERSCYCNRPRPAS